MTKFELEKLHMELCIAARTLMDAKNDSYAYGNDPFKNFRRHGLQGILVRLHDKFERLDSLVESGKLEMCGETVADTVMDIINYAVLFSAMSEEIPATVAWVDPRKESTNGEAQHSADGASNECVAGQSEGVSWWGIRAH